MLDLGLRTSRPPPAPPHPGLRALLLGVVGALVVVGGLALAGLEMSHPPAGPVPTDLFGRRLKTPLMTAACALLAIGAISAFLGGREVRRQGRARRALRDWAERNGFTLDTPDDAAGTDGEDAGVHVRILYRSAGLGDASGLLVVLPRGWTSDVTLFGGTSAAIGKRIDSLLASARLRGG